MFTRPERTGSSHTLTRVLVADPDPNMRWILSTACRLEGWEAVIADDGAGVLDQLRTRHAHLVVTELAMPDVDGHVLLGKIRAEYPHVPIVVIGGGRGARHRVACLAAGADDYVAKPFDIEEVVLRVQGLLRRRAHDLDPPPRLVVGDLELDEISHEVVCAGAAVDLTNTEFRLLRYLMCNPRRVLSKPQILGQVWSHDFRGRESIVELYISYLRRKLADCPSPRIHTVRGVGYVLRPG